MALQKLENWQLRKANVLNDRTDLPDALKYQRKRWKAPGQGFQHNARDKGVQLLDRKQKAAEKRRAALEDDLHTMPYPFAAVAWVVSKRMIS